MKKLLLAVILLTIATSFIGSPSMAAVIYFDPMVGGSRAIEINPYSVTGDAAQHIVGLEIPVDKFKVGVEYFQGTLAGEAELGTEDSDFDGFELKGGFNIINNPELKVDLIATEFNQEYQNPAVEVEGTLVGADLTYRFSNKTFFNGSISQSINAEYGGLEASILNYRFKLIQMLNRNVAVAAGYRYYTIDVGNWLFDQKFTTSGPVVSVSYDF